MESLSTCIRVLFLGGAHAQIPVIREAKQRGYYIITCDYLPQNPGHKYADEYYNISTTDTDAVYDLAVAVKPDLIIAYASDPAAPVAAYVSEKLGLPGNHYESVCILTEKDRFRLLQQKLNLPAPVFCLIKNGTDVSRERSTLQYPLIIKPTDSSGSKGVSKVSGPDQLEAAYKEAMQFSRNKRIIAEEYIDNQIADIHGDGFVINGDLLFACMGDHLYNKLTNPYNPVGTLWPSRLPEPAVKEIIKDAAALIKASGFKNGAVNIEARVNSKGKSYIMEIGPRNGGHFVPQAIRYATGFDMVKAGLDVMLGNPVKIPRKKRRFSAYYAIHSDHEGTLDELTFLKELLPYISEFHQYVSFGEKVRSFRGANAAIGILILTFTHYDEMLFFMTNIENYIDLRLSVEA
jgi:biotin carboxylase